MTLRPLALACGLLIAGLALYASFPPAGQGAQPAGDHAASTSLLKAAPHDLSDRLKACTGCHGDQGRAGPDGYYPRIAGKPEGYLLQQLLHFRDGRRQGPSMAWMVQGLRDESLAQIAAHFANQHPPYPPISAAASAAAAALGPAALRRGEQLVRQGDATRQLPACADCHGEKLKGIAPAMPGLLGLPRDYLNAQLGAWRNGERKAAAPDCMADIAKALTPEDVIAVTTWLAAQPVPGDGRAEKPSPVPLRLPLECGAVAVQPKADRPQRPSESVARGAYLARIGNCAACHTAPGGQPYAGGKAVLTPFGTVYGGNLTPHATGLGGWSTGDFWRAMHEGRSRDGRALNPAFPYTDFTHITREDSDALFAWLQTLPAVDQPARAAALRFPWNIPGLIRVWQWLFFKPQPFVAQSQQSVEWNRGAYLVQGLGHCGACHTPRNALGAPQAEGHDALAFSGAELQAQGWHAPSLRTAQAGGVGHWPLTDIEQWLTTGRAPGGQANGPMARIVSQSLTALTPDDRRAMAVYLKSLSPSAVLVDPSAALPVTSSNPQAAAAVAKRDPAAQSAATRFVDDGSPASALYRKHCADCHGDAGEGRGPLWPALAGHRVFSQPTLTNAARIVLHGGFGADVPGEPLPAGMPPFAGPLSDTQVAQLLRWMQAASGSGGRGIEPARVNALRSVPVE